MALKTLGSNSTTILRAVQLPADDGSTTPISAADVASINALINDDFMGIDGGPLNQGAGPNSLALRQWPGALMYGGGSSALLSIPNRGTITCYPGDWIVVDPQGLCVFVIPSAALPSTLTLSGTTVNLSKTITFASSVTAIGWTVGMAISGTNVPAASVIQTISADGKTITINNAATGSASNTMTVANWTHN